MSELPVFKTEADEEIQRLKQRELELMARVARLEKALDYAGVKLLEHKDRRAYEYVDKILCEEAPQSLAHVRAGAVEDAVLNCASCIYTMNGLGDMLAVRTLVSYANQLRQQADKG